MQSSSQIITTNKPTPSFFTGRMPFLSPNQQRQSTEEKNITFHGLAELMTLFVRSSTANATYILPSRIMAVLDLVANCCTCLVSQRFVQSAVDLLLVTTRGSHVLSMSI